MLQIANNIKIGNVINYQDNMCEVLNTNHTKPGKGGAYVQMEIKDVVSGTKFTPRFPSGDKIEIIIAQEQDYQYLYNAGDIYYFMDNQSFEQVELEKSKLDKKLIDFLQPEMNVKVQKLNDIIVSVKLNKHITVTVELADAVVKGQTSAGSFKNATLTNGVNIKVPLFINSGDQIVINTETLEYVERA